MKKSQLDEGAPPDRRTSVEVCLTVERIKDEIRGLRPKERLELYKWLDDDVAADFCSRIGADRSIEIRRNLGRVSQVIHGRHLLGRNLPSESV